MPSSRLLTILIACPVWLATPAMAQSTGQAGGKAVTGAANAPARMQMTSPGKKPPPRGSLTPAVTVMPLTKGECEGLGGTADFNATCAALGQKGCYTVDSDGVIRVSCINRK